MPTAAKNKTVSEGQRADSTIGDYHDGQDATLTDHQGTTKKGFRFWAIIASLLVATFLSALDLTGEFWLSCVS